MTRMTTLTLMLALLTGLHLVPESADAKPTLRNNSGRAAYHIIRAMPDDLRDKFQEKMATQRSKQWHQEMKAMHREMKNTTQSLVGILKEGDVDRVRTDRVLKNMQDQMAKTGTNAMNTMRSVLIEVLAEASPEEREEMIEELEEVLADWEEYRPRPRRWWQFWR